MSIVYIVSAPSGSGKSTLVNELFKMVGGLDFSISYTTRTPRGSEQNGKEYFFVSQPEFEAMIVGDEFLEYAKVFGNDGNYYGTARRFLREAVAAVVAFAAQNRDALRGKRREALGQELHHAVGGVLHQHDSGNAGLHGAAVHFSHLGCGENFHMCVRPLLCTEPRALASGLPQAAWRA